MTTTSTVSLLLALPSSPEKMQKNKQCVISAIVVGFVSVVSLIWSIAVPCLFYAWMELTPWSETWLRCATSVFKVELAIAVVIAIFTISCLVPYICLALSGEIANSIAAMLVGKNWTKNPKNDAKIQ